MNEPREIAFSVDIIIEPDGDEFHAYCPALKGLHTSGRTVDEACQHAADAAVAYLESLLRHNEPIPLTVPPLKAARKAVSRCHRTPVLQVAFA